LFAQDYSHMKKDQNLAMPPVLTQSLRTLGTHIARLRKARRLIQAEAAVRANISRETASRIENGDAAVAIGQVVRYLAAIAPGVELGKLNATPDAALALMEQSEKRQRARALSEKERERYDF
jgi:transcriptional regulator with XRE-family HTH domain